MKKIISVAEPNLGNEEAKNLQKAVKSGWVSGGAFVDRFEKEFARYCGVKFAVTTCNGTSALHLALRCLGIGPGDEVIVPALTFVATINAVLYTGAKPIFVDIEPETLGINPKLIEAKITSRTKAILIVHLYGHPVDFNPIARLAKRHQLPIVEDAAEALGSLYKGKKVGSLGKIGCFSFFGNKLITTGEGGMLVTNHQKLAKKARFLRNQATLPGGNYLHTELGYNFLMTNLQAAVGVAQLGKIERFLKRKQEIASLYKKLLTGTAGLRLPSEKAWALNSYWMYSPIVEPKYPLTRNELIEALKARGIETRPFFVALPKLPFLKDEKGSYPVAYDVSKKGINLPSGTTITNNQVSYICNIIKKLRH